MLSFINSIILGVVEGVTEFLPVSSTGHLTIAEKLMHLPIDDPGLTAYTAIIQVGAMLAAIIYFWKDIVRIVAGWFTGLGNKAKRGADYNMGWAVIAGTMVTVVIGLLGKARLHRAAGTGRVPFALGDDPAGNGCSLRSQSRNLQSP